ncbi:phage protein [Streptococcus agalactiae]|nr:hypothetical protein SAG0317_02935 [Streptococcus agalactiae GB00219]EPV23767.1 hypothetical protein SAG0335_05535 [Streptococcus agalactiae GB00651]EPV98058.1 hypothetical protein SAG0039_05990 [Streptococcus agalactiae FSL S3-014]EPW02635.1 hypothetical protein SAG0043_07030 [Streptococcus agalactiae FSL S3-137]EPW58496.1 hypothetical protein SAG0086_06905 [Streptococcus agalactiae LMG 15090]EPW64085.1 hypothetical protein SAG0095_03335 [Streptococcus agalactiae BSU248]EPX26768.1 hypothe
MRPKKYPYTGKAKLIRKELPRFIQIADIAFESSFINHIKTMRMASNRETIIYLQIPKFFVYEEKQIRVRLPLRKVVEVLNKYK